METPETVEFSTQHLVPVMLVGIVGLVVLFVILALVRLWGIRMQSKSGACGGIDLEDLRRRRDAGAISQAEYEAVCATLTDGQAGAAAGRKTPIDRTSDGQDQADADQGGSERSPADGEA